MQTRLRPARPRHPREAGLILRQVLVTRVRQRAHPTTLRLEESRPTPPTFHLRPDVARHHSKQTLLKQATLRVSTLPTQKAIHSSGTRHARRVRARLESRLSCIARATIQTLKTMTLDSQTHKLVLRTRPRAPLRVQRRHLTRPADGSRMVLLSRHQSKSTQRPTRTKQQCMPPLFLLLLQTTCPLPSTPLEGHISTAKVQSPFPLGPFPRRCLQSSAPIQPLNALGDRARNHLPLRQPLTKTHHMPLTLRISSI
jgi:hypothetical protein